MLFRGLNLKHVRTDYSYAVIAQLGERQTEGLNVGSPNLSGTISNAPPSLLFANARLYGSSVG